MVSIQNIEISKKQAQEFALSIFSDIEMYVKSHQEKCEYFQRNEEKIKKEGEKVND